MTRPNYRPRPPPPRHLPEEVIKQLKYAASTNDLPAIENLLETHFTTNTIGLHPVMSEALKRDHAAAVAKLLSYGVNMHYSSVLEAVGFKAKASLEVFLQKGFDINKPLSETQPTVFAYAIKDTEMTLWLLEHGADLNKSTYIDLTPMSFAAEYAPPELLRELLNRGGDVRRGEVLQYALDRPADVVEVLGMLIDHGAPLNLTMYENHQASKNLYPFMGLGTPLHKAAEMGKADVVRFLLERKADRNIRDQKGRTALQCAQTRGHKEVVDILKSI
ncbi:putative hspc200 [Coniochaeta ligniaria NRRL 30616]|uniref:Putative hspc200 n=1 Tax=Coniochaeta ligniaria NRRL 30616 TaxID=1408157 RepID=A0A1J7JMH2_9PEZI|nr:putative hspc200 [Coniochaeta ligniaria NRRL 30616]